MKIAIIDDDIVFAQELKTRVEKICKKSKIDFSVTSFSSIDDIFDENEIVCFDVVFLDIEMPGINGIELAAGINKMRGDNITPYVVFVTAKDNLVFEALKKYPYSFVRKSHLEEIAVCLKNINKKLISSPTYSIKVGRDIKVLTIETIICLEKQGNYIAYYTTGGILQERTGIEEKYKDLARYGFVRPHIGALVNAVHIIEYNSSLLKLSNGKEINISRSYKKLLKEEFNEWMVKFR